MKYTQLIVILTCLLVSLFLNCGGSDDISDIETNDNNTEDNTIQDTLENDNYVEDIPEFCVDNDGDNYGVGQICLGPDCDDTSELCNTSCVDGDNDTVYDCKDNCIDADGDSYGEGQFCVATDCNDNNPHCNSYCDDLDSDGWCIPLDCDDNNVYCNADCTIDADADGLIDCVDDTCIDKDRDSFGSGAGCAGQDCDDNNPNVWVSCSNCIDADADGYYVGCDAYTTVAGVDCNDNDGYCFTDCGNCGDSCNNPYRIAQVGKYRGDTTFRNNVYQYCCEHCVGWGEIYCYDGPDEMWYFIPDNQSYYYIELKPLTVFNPVLGIHQGCPDTNYCVDNNGTSGTEAVTNVFNTIPYYIRIDGSDSGDRGPYELSIYYQLSGEGQTCLSPNIIGSTPYLARADFSQYHGWYNFSENTNCGFAEGQEVLFQYTIKQGEGIVIEEENPDLDTIIRVLLECNETAECIANQDEPEVLMYFNTTNTDQDLYIVLEAKEANATGIFMFYVYPAR